MAEYSLDKRLPSCEVNQQLLADIEAYVLRRWEEVNEGKGACKYTFSITDSIGSETLESVKDYKFHSFPNDVKQVTLWLIDSPMMIRIKFDADSITSNVMIRLDDPNARELARGILNGILDIIRPFETRNYVFDPYLGYSPILVIVAIALIWVAGSTTVPLLSPGQHDKAVSLGGIAALILIFPLAFFVRRLRPYTTFETRLNQSRARIWNWFVFGVFGSLVAGVILLAVERLWKP